jgi:hypothetical protein
LINKFTDQFCGHVGNVFFAGMQSGTEVAVETVNAVEVNVTVDVCFKKFGRTAVKIGLRKMRLPAMG